MRNLLAVLFLILVGPGSAHASLLSTLNEVSPTPMSFAFGVDQIPFAEGSGFPEPVTGNATGLLQLVPHFGCSSSDFSSFAAGDIALISRGGSPSPCSFSLKETNAEAAGAIAFIVFDNTVEPLSGVFFLSEVSHIPGLFISNGAGQTLETALHTGPVEVSLSVSSVPEPSTLTFVASVILLAAAGRFRVSRCS